MKTHELAKELSKLAGSPELHPSLQDSLRGLALVLGQAPDIEIRETQIRRKKDDVAVGLKLLSSLSSYTKQQWLALVKDYDLKIALNPRDSARDVLGKVLRYLDEHPELLKTMGAARPPKARPSKVDTAELENALLKLLRRKDD